MSTPGSSGRAGPTPISGASDGVHDGEQVRPSFHFGSWHLSLGDTITGIHRERRAEIEGSVVVVSGCLCVSTRLGVFPIQKIAIHSVQPPLPYEELEAA